MQTRKQGTGRQETEERKQVTKDRKTSMLRTDKKETGESRTKKLMIEKHGNKVWENKETEYWKKRKPRTRKRGNPGQENNRTEENKETEDRWTGKLKIENLVNST
jgi:hypothetical protein